MTPIRRRDDGYDDAGLRQQIERGTDFETFFAEAPSMNSNTGLITGVVCGVRVEVSGGFEARLGPL